jgi:hypothetical protein
MILFARSAPLNLSPPASVPEPPALLRNFHRASAPTACGAYVAFNEKETDSRRAIGLSEGAGGQVQEAGRFSEVQEAAWDADLGSHPRKTRYMPDPAACMGSVAQECVDPTKAATHETLAPG